MHLLWMKTEEGRLSLLLRQLLQAAALVKSIEIQPTRLLPREMGFLLHTGLDVSYRIWNLFNSTQRLFISLLLHVFLYLNLYGEKVEFSEIQKVKLS